MWLLHVADVLKKRMVEQADQDEVKGVQKNSWVSGKCHNLIFINSRRREIKWKCKIYSKNFEGNVSMIYIPFDIYHSMMIKIQLNHKYILTIPVATFVTNQKS